MEVRLFNVRAKTAKTKNAFIGCICPYVGHSHDNQYPSHQSIVLTQEPIHEIFTKKIWELAILKNSVFLVGHFDFFFCFLPIKISPNLYGRMDVSKFWCFPSFPENSLLCVILRYRVYFLFHSEDSTYIYKTKLG